MDSRESDKTSAEIEAAWDAEIKAHIERYDPGETKGIPAEEVFAKLRQRQMAGAPPDFGQWLSRPRRGRSH